MTTLVWGEPVIPAPPPPPTPKPKPGKCTTFAEHVRLWSLSERTWRLTADQRQAEWSYGCPYCLLPTAESVVSPSPLLPRRYA